MPKIRSSQKAFTLIEVLVVVAILALLISILLPSLARARQQVQTVACQANMSTLAKAFLLYAADNKERLPATECFTDDWRYDWLKTGAEIPESGDLYKKYMGSEEEAYRCPSDRNRTLPSGASAGSTTEYDHSYTSVTAMCGAAVEWAIYAHYREEPDVNSLTNYSPSDHTQFMKRLAGVPMLIEEDVWFDLMTNQDSGWIYRDSITNRHLSTGRGRGGKGNMGFTDGHVETMNLRSAATEYMAHQEDYPSLDAYKTTALTTPRAFTSNSLCIRLAAGKWASLSDAIDDPDDSDKFGQLYDKIEEEATHVE